MQNDPKDIQFRRTRCTIAVLAFLLGGAWVTNAQQTIYVNGTTGNDAYTGLCESWDGGTCGPKKTIGAGMAIANNGDTVVVAEGIYTGPGNRDLDFAGKAITVRSVDPGDPDIVAATVIDCQGTPEDRHRAFSFLSGEGPGSVLAGLTMVNGCAPLVDVAGLFFAPLGGAILCLSSSPTIEHSVLSANLAVSGGAIYCDYGNILIRCCTFTDNKTEIYYFEGGIYTPDGGAVCCNHGSPVIEYSSFLRNRSWSDFSMEMLTPTGGAVSFYDCAARIAACDFHGNFIELAGGYGGAIFSWSSDPNRVVTIEGCTIAESKVIDVLGCECGGGAAYTWDAAMQLIGCAIYGNSAGPSGYGGALGARDSGGLTLTNCIISGNHAARGGALACTGTNRAKLLIGNCTVVRNRAAQASVVHWASFSRRITNSIIWNGTQWTGSWFSVAYSDVQGGYTGEGNIDSDPLFEDLGYWDDNGTPGAPDDDVWVNGDYHLRSGSPAIDAADNARVPLDASDLDGDGNTSEPVPYDLDGLARFRDDPETPDTGIGSPPIVDMGAYEYQASAGDLNCDGLVDPRDINPFVLALSKPWLYEQTYPSCNIMNADINGDGLVDFGDINPFVALLTGH